MPPKIFSTETLKKDILSKNVNVTCNRMRTAVISRIGEKKREVTAITEKLKDARPNRRYYTQKWRTANLEVKSVQTDLAAAEAETARLQASIRTLISLPEEITNLVDSSFGGELLIFGKMPPSDKIFTQVCNYVAHIQLSEIMWSKCIII